MSVTYDLRDFTEEQKVFFKRAEAEGLDVSYIYDPELSTDQMIEICEGLQAGVNVEPFAKSCYSWEQMQELCEAIKAEMDITPFSNPEYPTEQMRAIKNAILNGEPYDELLDSSKFVIIDSTQAFIQHLKETYLPGMRVIVTLQQGDFTPEEGTVGTIKLVDDDGNLHILWDNGDERNIIQDTKVIEVITDEQSDSN